MRAVVLVIRSIHGEFPRHPNELFEQPAKWVAAFDFLLPYAQREIEEHRKREE